MERIILWDELQDSPIIHLVHSLTEEFLRGRSQHVPVLLEDAKVGCVASFSIAWGYYLTV